MKLLSSHLSSQQLSRHDKCAAIVRRSFARTEYHYQATEEVRAIASSPTRPGHDHAAKMRSFSELRNMAASKGAEWEDAAEATMFGLVAAIAAWSLTSLLVVLAETARG
jgi:hypothetical protein